MIFLWVFAAGAAALGWEVLWQIKASLSLGVSAVGTAVTLAATMGGMALGALCAGRVLRGRELARPLRAYALMELAIGLSGLVLLDPGFSLLEAVDSRHYLAHPHLMTFAHLVGIGSLLLIPTMAMGATIPLFGQIARARGASLSRLYAVNTLGAACGIFAITFASIPYLGVELTAIVLTTINLLVSSAAFLTRSQTPVEAIQTAGVRPADEAAPEARGRAPSLIALTTGFVSFGLEIAWFRSLRAAFWSTTQAFGLLLISVLVPLAVGSHLAAVLARRRTPMGLVLALSGACGLVATPIIERFDVLVSHIHLGYLATSSLWLLATLLALGPCVLLLGTCLPRLLDREKSSESWASLYALNTVGAMSGSLCAAWILLPTLGFSRSAWLLAVILVVTGMLITTGKVRWMYGGAGAIAFLVAVVGASGIGRTKVAGHFNAAPRRVVAFREAPDATYAVVDDADGHRVLVIDGFVATGEGPGTHYMAWMGRLPMILHPAPNDALVICFGTGQTANAVRLENPRSLDIVELSPQVLAMAMHFPKNDAVIEDPRVHAHAMDGRAWLRRTDRRYDVVTLEPMPPNFAGVNALYSREFYRLVASRMNPGGIAAQWVPFHLLSTHDAVAIVATFRDVFEDALVWLDPPSKTGIVVGRLKDSPAPPLGTEVPGMQRPSRGRDMNEAAVRRWLALDPMATMRYAAPGAIITDDNQLLAYGPKRDRQLQGSDNVATANLILVVQAAAGE